MTQARTASVIRNTSETQIELTINLDGTGQAELSTGLPFFEHMLTQIARHGLIDIHIQATGDLRLMLTTWLRMLALCWAKPSMKLLAIRAV